MRAVTTIALLVAITLAVATTVFALDFENEQLGTELEEMSSSSSFVELDSSISSPASFAVATHFATLSKHLTYDESVNHCTATSKKLTLCKAASLCTGGIPLDGIRNNRTMVAVADKPNSWISLGSDRTCEVRSGKTWGTTAVLKPFKGLVACCNSQGVVKIATLSQWEGFLVKSKRINAVYMVENGVRRAVPSAKSFEAYGFHYPRIKVLRKSQIEAIPIGKPLADISNKDKDTELFEHALLGYSHEGGNPFEAFEGYLIKKDGSSIICMVARASKKCIPDSETFEALGFEYKLVQVVDEWLYDNFPLATAFESRLGAAAGSEPYQHPLLGRDHFGTSSLKVTAVSTRSFIESTVRRLLDREATPNERRVFTRQLRQTRNVPEIVRRLLTSNAFKTKNIYPLLVHSLYSRLLEREPTAAESTELIEHFRKIHRSGDPTKTVKQIVEKIVLSKEHQDRFVTKEGLSHEHAVKNLYKHLLGREAESEAAVKGHADRVETDGWKEIIESFLSSNEYRSNIGPFGVPGDKHLYAPIAQSLYKKLLNVDPSKVGKSVLNSDAIEIAKDGWAEYVDEFIKRKEYIAENGKQGFLDETDHTITLREPSKKKGKKNKTQQ